MKQILFTLSLLIGIAGKGQKTMKYDSSDIKFIDASRKPDWASKPIPTIWASQQREIQELRKRLDSLIKAMRENPFNGAHLDSLPADHNGGIQNTSFTDSTTQSLISISPDGWTSVSSLPKKKSKRRGKPSTSKPPAKL